MASERRGRAAAAPLPLTTWHLEGEPLAALQAGEPAPGEPPRPVVMILHGFPDHPPSFAALARTLAGAGYHCVVPYLRGYAPSTRRGPFTLERLRDDALALLAVVSPGRPAALVGHDWGAMITYAACASAPERISCAVTLSVPAPLTFLRQLVTSRQLLRSFYMLLFQLSAADALARRADFALLDWLWRRWSPGFRLPDDDAAALHACLAASWPAPLAPYRALLHLPDLRRRHAELRRWSIHVPTLQLHGEQDGCIAPASAAHQRAWFAAPLEQVRLPDVGHFLHLEAPGEVASQTLRWLSAHHLRLPADARP